VREQNARNYDGQKDANLPVQFLLINPYRYDGHFLQPVVLAPILFTALWAFVGLDIAL
jgi:hypothetical protein